jgi:hypothetical protein
VSNVKMQVFDVKSIEITPKEFSQKTVSTFSDVPKKFDEFTSFELVIVTAEGEQCQMTLYVDGLVNLVDVLNLKPTQREF